MQEPGSPIGKLGMTVTGGARGGGNLWLRLEVPGPPYQVYLVWLSEFGYGIAFGGKISSGPGPVASCKCQEASVIEPGVMSPREVDAT